MKSKIEIAVGNRRSQEEQPRARISRDIGDPRVEEDYRTQVSEEIEGRVTRQNLKNSAELKKIFC